MKKVIIIIAVSASTLIIVALAYLIFDGTFTRNAIEKSIIKQYQETGEVNMTVITPFDWDFMFIFGPYVSEKNIEDTLGFDGWDYDGPLHDDLQLILFVRNDKTIQHVTMGRTPDLTIYSGQAYSPNNAIFTFSESNFENSDRQDGAQPRTMQTIIEECDLFNLPDRSYVSIELSFIKSPNEALRSLLFDNQFGCEGEDGSAPSCINWVISGKNLSLEVTKNLQPYASQINKAVCRYES